MGDKVSYLRITKIYDTYKFRPRNYSWEVNYWKQIFQQTRTQENLTSNSYIDHSNKLLLCLNYAKEIEA